MSDLAVAPTAQTGRRTLVAAGAAHVLHDGYTDLILVLLPVWQAEFGLGYAALALLRGVYTGVMAALQIPAGRLAERFGGRLVLAVGTALAGLGYAAAGFSGGLIGLCVALAISGAGSSPQHPVGSAAVSRAYGTASRGPLGVYNFTGDLGKAAFPALTAVLLSVMPWRSALWVIAALGIATAVLVATMMPAFGVRHEKTASGHAGAAATGFNLLVAIGVLDTAVRSGLMIFLPFLLTAKGADLSTIGFALALVFLGGAAGKFVCGWLSDRIGWSATVFATEGGTALAIFAVLVAPLSAALILAPILGVMLNGTSSALYGAVPQLTPPHRAEHAFAVFYTATVGAAAIAPVSFGLLGDAVGVDWATIATAATAVATLPLAFVLGPRLRAA